LVEVLTRQRYPVFVYDSVQTQLWKLDLLPSSRVVGKGFLLHLYQADDDQRIRIAFMVEMAMVIVDWDHHAALSSCGHESCRLVSAVERG
jgi:hypothetical protein